MDEAAATGRHLQARLEVRADVGREARPVAAGLQGAAAPDSDMGLASRQHESTERREERRGRHNMHDATLTDASGEQSAWRISGEQEAKGWRRKFRNESLDESISCPGGIILYSHVDNIHILSFLSSHTP